MFTDGFKPRARRRREIQAVAHAGELDIRRAARMEAVDHIHKIMDNTEGIAAHESESVDSRRRNRPGLQSLLDGKGESAYTPIPDRREP